jgi:DNA repair protein RadD
MIEINELIITIPSGKKREHLGQLFVNALTDYYENHSTSEIDLDDLIINEFKELILTDNFINDLKLFSYEKLEIILNKENKIENLSILNLRKIICKYYSLNYEKDIVVKRIVTTIADVEFPLHDFQERIRRKVINLMFNGQKRFLIHMPTGSGKTRTASEIILDFIRFSSSKALLQENIKILWIAQSSELCFQAYETIKSTLQKKGTIDISLGNFYDEFEISDELLKSPAIIFCGIQKLLLNYRKPIWEKIRGNCYLVIVDEAHRSVASQWVQALNYFVTSHSVYLLGLTATPGIGSISGDSSYSLVEYYNGNKIAITDNNYIELTNPIHFLTEKGFLANINRIDIDAEVESNDGIEIDQGGNLRFTSKTLKGLSVNHSRNASIINIIKNNNDLGKKILVFTCGLEHNKILKCLLKSYNILSESIDESTSNRNNIIDSFKYGSLNILLNYGVLTTGFDAPKTDVCIIARPITSVVMYSQMVGRILRGPLNGGNETNSLYTIKDNFEHGDYDNLFKSFDQFYL